MTTINSAAIRFPQGGAAGRAISTEAGGQARAGFVVTPQGLAAGRHVQTAGGADYKAGVAAGPQGLVGGRQLTTSTGHADSFTVVNRSAGTIDRQQSFDNVAGHGYSGSRAVHMEDGTLQLSAQLSNPSGQTVRAKDLQVALPKRA